MRVALSALVGTSLFLGAATSAAQTSDATRAQDGPPQAGPGQDAPPQAGPKPPPPPPPGLKVAGSEAPAPITNVFGADSERGAPQEELVGFKGGFFFRDRRDHFRLYPEALLEVDLQAPLGAGVSGVATRAGGDDLKTKFVLRRARLGLEAELLRRWSVHVSGELGQQAVANPASTIAAGAPAETASAGASLADVWIDYRLCSCFSLMFGQFNAPLGIENRTPDAYTPFNERNVAIRGLVAPGSKDIGAMAFGYFGDRFINYELGIFGGDGPNRPSVDSRFDFMGRLFARPFVGAGRSEIERTTQIGVSARFGERDSKSVDYDVPAITSGEGFALWSPTYVDSIGRTIHVIPSAAQTTVGGELRAAALRMSLQAEAYYVDDHTREAVDGFQSTNTERLGAVRGAGWYVQLSGWPLGDPFVRPEPGIYGPRQLDLHASDATPRGLELLAVLAGIDATYDGSKRGGTADPSAPPHPITIYQVGLAAQYWYTQHVRVSFDYDLYVTPGSDKAKNGAVVPDQLLTPASGAPPTSTLLHELGVRVTVSL